MRVRTLMAVVGLAVLGIGIDGTRADGQARRARQVEPLSGTATYTDLTGLGTCSFPDQPADDLHVGVSTTEYGGAAACGSYLDVTGPRGTVRVLVTDHCPRCPAGQLDLSRAAFLRIGELSAGRVPVTYAPVRNPPLDVPISLRMKDGSSRSWWQIQVLDHGNPIARVEVATADGWRSLVRSEDNFWTAGDPEPRDGPFTVRITDVYGQHVTIDQVVLAPGQAQPTVARLYELPAPATTRPAEPADERGAEALPGERAAPAPTPTPASRPNRDSDSVGPLFVLLGAAIAAGQVAAWWRRRHFRPTRMES